MTTGRNGAADSPPPCGGSVMGSHLVCHSGCNRRKEVIHDYLKIGDFTLLQGDAEKYFKAKSEKREFHNWRDYV